MFTGIIQKLGSLGRRVPRGNGQRLTVGHAAWESPLALGESVAVNGVCLTVAEAGSGQFMADVLNETLTKTTLGAKASGAAVNLERALRLDERLGGHLVQGHVDGTGTVAGIRRTGSDWALEVACETALLDGMAPKGSIAIDGVSLTIVELKTGTFTVHLIPHTWEQTAFKALKAGDRVNLETDIIGKYVNRYMERLGGQKGLTLETLQRAGFGG
jgi:riboflavin synthase